MKKLLSFLLAIGLVLSLSHCRHRKHDPEKFANHIVKKISGELDLNDAQKKHLESIKTEFLQKRKDKKAEKEEVHKLVMAELKKDSIDKAKVNEIFAKTDKGRNEMREYFTDKLIEFHKTLSPEQKKKLVELAEKMYARRWGH
ncbi:MAG: Spy/CpxP family protein refolding chaperone [Leptospiraceae bacterium]|nr:Spy/CpxP family protein refolding chaperone [Leptospiraceae bacterium]